MIRTIRPDLSRALALLACAALGCAGAPTSVREPSWPGTTPSSGSPGYSETLDAVQFLLEEYSQGLRQRAASPTPCVLQVVRSDDLSQYPLAAPGSVYESTWVDLSRVTGLQARTMDGDGGGAPGSTCASFAGGRGFAVRTDIVPKGKGRRKNTQLADDASPRVCIGSNAHPERLAAPLRQLVTLCGGRTAKGKPATAL
jgi:hypothetical protein